MFKNTIGLARKCRRPTLIGWFNWSKRSYPDFLQLLCVKSAGKNNFLINEIGKSGRGISGVIFYIETAEENVVFARIISGAAEVRQ